MKQRIIGRRFYLATLLAGVVLASGVYAANWQEGLTYNAGDIVEYNGKSYTALATHSAYAGTNWNPESTPTLWKEMAPAIMTASIAVTPSPVVTPSPPPIKICKSGSAWSPTKTYQPNDCASISYGNESETCSHVYTAIRTNINSNPSSGNGWIRDPQDFGAGICTFVPFITPTPNSTTSSPVTPTPTVAPSPAWDKTIAYVGGARVNYNGVVYEAQWWTQADVPGIADWSPWKRVSIADPNPQPVATFYQHTEYQGYSVSLPEGTYTKADLLAKGILDNDLSSLKVADGYIVILFDAENASNSGRLMFATADLPHFFADDFNDLTSSIRIVKKSDIAANGAAPTEFHGTVGSPTRISLNWKKNPGDEMYVIEQLKNGSFQEILTTRANQSFATLNDLPPNTSFTFRVYAINASGKSPVSQTLTVNTWPESKTGGWDHFRAPNIVFTDKAPDSEGSKLINQTIPSMNALIADHLLDISRLIYFSENDKINLFTDMGFVLDPNGPIGWKAGDSPSINMGMNQNYLLDYYNSNGKSKAALINEIVGMIAHEGTHGYQFTPKNAGLNNEAGSFVEGLADYVRIELGLHPRAIRRVGAHYNDGYSETGFFIKWLTDTKDPNFARKLNASARDMENWSWDAACLLILGQNLDSLWREYQASI